MYAVLNGNIQHFPAQNLSNFKDKGFTFFDDDGNKINDSEIDEAAEEEIKSHTFTININSVDALNASLVENGFSPETLTQAVPFTDDYNPIKKITDYLETGVNNG